MEQGERETAGAVRNQNVVYTLPFDRDASRQFLVPALDRIDAAASGVQLLVITPDSDAALDLAYASARPGITEGDLVAVTSGPRGVRLLRERTPAAVAGSAEDLAHCLAASALKLADLKAVVLAWPDIASPEANTALEAVMAEVPKDAARSLVAERMTPEIDALIERYMRRAARMGDAADEGARDVTLYAMTVGSGNRGDALRRLLDEIDPPSAIIVTRTDESEREARAALRAIGHGEADPNVKVTRGEIAGNPELVVLFDVPVTRDAIDRVAGAKAPRTIVFARPRQLDGLRRMARIVPFALRGAAASARKRETKLREEMRAQLAAGAGARDIFTIEPLLEEYDATEVAAALLRLLEREREKSTALPRVATPETAPLAAPGGASMTKMFINIGAKDGARAGDLVGGISNEAGITSSQIGKVDIRDAFSLVEIASPIVNQVIEKITGTTIKGRRVSARLERDRGESGKESRGGPRPGGDRGDRPRSFAPRGDRPDRGDRGDRPRGGPPRGGAPRGGKGGPPRGDSRPPRGGADFGPRTLGDRDEDTSIPRAARESQEWGERAERLRHTKPRRPDAIDSGEGNDQGDGTP